MIQNFPLISIEGQHEILSRLIEHHAFISLDWGGNWRYKRARIVSPSEDINSYKQLIWPPKAAVRSGRANLEGAALLYLADRTETAHSEIHAQNDNILLTQFGIRSKKSFRVLPIGEFTFINRSGRGRLLRENESLELIKILNACKREEQHAYLIVDSFLHQHLVGDTPPYSISAFICHRIFQKYPDVSSISYPSVQRYGATNFAVKTKDFWKTWGISSVSRYSVKQLSQGFFDITERTNVIDITSNGTLCWENSLDQLYSTNELNELWIPLEFR
jgi:hypothetical protein